MDTLVIERIVLLLLLLGALALFASEKVRADLVSLGLLLALMVLGIITVEEGFRGFAAIVAHKTGVEINILRVELFLGVFIGAVTFIAFLPPSPVSSQAPFVNFDWLTAPFTVMPIQMFNWISRPQADFHISAAAAGVVLVAMTLLMNGTAIYLRYRARKRIKW